MKSSSFHLYFCCPALKVTNLFVVGFVQLRASLVREFARNPHGSPLNIIVFYASNLMFKFDELIGVKFYFLSVKFYLLRTKFNYLLKVKFYLFRVKFDDLLRVKFYLLRVKFYFLMVEFDDLIRVIFISSGSNFTSSRFNLMTSSGSSLMTSSGSNFTSSRSHIMTA